jgi:ABC-type lipoprotein export system ATPase subunit
MSVTFDIEVGGAPSRTVRAQQLSAAFDVPLRDRETLRWRGELPLDDRDWNVGLIVGPSGSGKTTILTHAFGQPIEHEWSGLAVVDDFPAAMRVDDLAAVCQAVGFNTIPAWLRPHDVLSTGEQFRVGLARALAEAQPDRTIVLDEFTSVVDRQVAKIGAHAVSRYVRKRKMRLVVATCHYDVVDWLQPDWTLEPATLEFTWRHLQPRPALDCTISREPYASWARFAPFHYLTSDLNHSAQCYVLSIGATPAAFCGVLHRPHPRNRAIKAVSRLVTLPDWQGLGLAFALVDRVAAAYMALGYDVHTYPAHPALIRSFDRSRMWELRHRPGTFAVQHGPNSMQARQAWAAARKGATKPWKQGRRPNAVFRYRGAPLDVETASALTGPVSTTRKRTRTSASVRGYNERREATSSVREATPSRAASSSDKSRTSTASTTSTASDANGSRS